MLVRKKRIDLDITLESCLAELETRFAVLPIDGRICLRAFELPRDYLRDPADCIIVATALFHGLPLVTADDAIRQSKVVNTIW